ncbi:hypothetical protein R2R70_02375 [Cobetia sp. SIMBA_158]|uniref:hypothetical protein n=1 Tax=Cobetia sp. SIMBA_158 TaxID=3081617 RepID=UPI00397F1AB1
MINAKFLQQQNPERDTLQHYLQITGTNAVYAVFDEYQEESHASLLSNEIRDVATWDVMEPQIRDLRTDRPDQVFGPSDLGLQLIEGLPADDYGRGDKRFIFMGAIAINLASELWGEDELVDCSLFDILGDSKSAPIGFNNRLEHTRSNKIAYSARFRSHRDQTRTLVNVFFPYAPSSFEDACHIGISHGIHQPISNLVNDAGEGIPGTKLVDSIYKLVPEQETYQVPENGTVTLTFSAVWPASFDYDKEGGELLLEPIDVVADTRAGYVPRRLKRTQEGTVSFEFMALGLTAGETVKFKVGAGYVTKLGSAVVEVISA